MNRRDVYFFKAAELTELAKNAKYSALKAQFENLALAYFPLSRSGPTKTRCRGATADESAWTASLKRAHSVRNPYPQAWAADERDTPRPASMRDPSKT